MKQFCIIFKFNNTNGLSGCYDNIVDNVLDLIEEGETRFDHFLGGSIGGNIVEVEQPENFLKVFLRFDDVMSDESCMDSCNEFVRWMKNDISLSTVIGINKVELKRSGSNSIDKAATKSENDPVEHPAHYEHDGVECIDMMYITQGYNATFDFCVCNTFKYLWRWKTKNGIQDLKKARWYLNRAIEMFDQNLLIE